jgi:hypothetical protein
MNKYSIHAHLQQDLKLYQSTLKQTSFDKENQEYLCQDEVLKDVYDFDAYIQKTSAHPIPASPDAIYIGVKNLYLIEFKNQFPADIDKQQMQRKFRAGTIILQRLLQQFTPKDCQYCFCVVFKNQPKPRYMDFRHVANNVVKFGLSELNEQLGNFYDRIVTEHLDFYVNEFKSLMCTRR